MSEPTPTAPETTGAEQATRRRDGTFAPGRSGNPSGRPKGARHKATVLAEQLIDEAAGRLTEKCIEMAFAGDTVALKIVMDRLIPPRKSRTITIDLPEIRTAADLLDAQGRVATAMAGGEISPDEAAEVSKTLEFIGAAIERRDLEARSAALEEGTME